MRVSWKWLSELVDLSKLKGPEQLAELLTSRGLEVEGIFPLSRGFENIVTAQILERNPHPQADRLSLCIVTDGGPEKLEIVCGAQNMKAGDKVALAKIGAALPNGMKIAKSKIRGVMSSGMLCSGEELCLEKASEGIMILPVDTGLGIPLAEFLGRDDTVLELSITPNRGDCLSHAGIAREVAAALGTTIKLPNVSLLGLNNSPISTKLDTGSDATQFWGSFIEGVKIGPSPRWLVNRLESLGLRSINNVVDATNLVLLEVGQPMHAYDADLLKGGELSVRMAVKGEQLSLLDGQTVTLAGTELVISDKQRAVALAGVMGGGNSEVRDGTTKLFLECAEFSPVLVRRAAAAHQRRTEAASRFEKQIDSNGLHYAISRLAHLIIELAGGKVIGSTSAVGKQKPLKRIEVLAGFFSDYLGFEVQSDLAERILISLGCSIEKEGQKWFVTAPSFRPDLTIKEDLVEEVARSIGYDKIPSTMPILTSAPVSVAGDPEMERLALLDKTKDSLVESGFFEIVNYSFTSKTWLAQLGMESTVNVLNPLSEEQEAMVPSLLPGMIKCVLENWRHYFGSETLPIRLFELRPTFRRLSAGEADPAGTGVQENWKLAIALSGWRYSDALNTDQQEVDFYDLKAVLENVFERLGTKGVRFCAPSTPNPMFHPGKSAEVVAGRDVAGVFGLVHPQKARQLKFRAPVWLAEIDWEPVMRLSRGAYKTAGFTPWSEFPTIERDFAILIKQSVEAEKITQIGMKIGKPLVKSVKIFDTYQGHQVLEGMTSVAVRVIFSSNDRSLQESEADEASARILEKWKQELGAVLRS